MKKLVLQTLLFVFMAGMGLVVTGCSTTESENESVRPWNAPNGWEHNMPSSLYNNRR